MARHFIRPQRASRWLRRCAAAVLGPFGLEALAAELAQQLTFLRWVWSWPAADAISTAGRAMQQWLPPARAIAAVMAALIAVPLTAAAALVAAQTASRTAWPVERWVALRDSMIRPAVVDSRGALVGFLPPPGAKDLEAAFAVQADHIPDACIDLVLYQEDRNHAGQLHWRGVDLAGLARGLTGTGGGSTLPMQLARLLEPKWTQQPKAIRKLLEIAAAPALVDVHTADARSLARTYLSIAPFGQAYGDVRGIAAAADVFFGISASKLTPAQCAVLVAQLPRPLPLARRDEEHVLKGWKSNIQRAERNLASAASGAYREFIPALDAWRQAVPIRREIPGAGEAARLNLGARTRHFVLQHEGRIRVEAVAPAVDAARTEPTLR